MAKVNNLNNFFFDRLLMDPTRTSRLYIKKEPEGGGDNRSVSNRDFYLVGIGFSNTINNVNVTHNWGGSLSSTITQRALEFKNKLSQLLASKRDEARFGSLLMHTISEYSGDSSVVGWAANKAGELASETGGILDTAAQAVGNMFEQKYITAGEAAKFFQGTDISLEPNITIPIVPRAFIASDKDPIQYKVWENGKYVSKTDTNDFKEGDIISTKWQLRKILTYLVGESGYGNFTVNGKPYFTEDKVDKTESSEIFNLGDTSFTVGAMDKSSDFSPFLMQKSPNGYIGNAISFKYDCENTFRLVVGGRNITGEDAYDAEVGSSSNKSYSQGNGSKLQATANTSNTNSSIFDNLLLQNVSIEESNIKVNMTAGSGQGTRDDGFRSNFITEDCPLYIMLRLNFVPAYMYDKFQLYEALSLRDKVQTAMRTGRS